MFTNIMAFLLVMCALVSALAQQTTAPSPVAALVQAAHSVCSPDGLWNCMTQSFQRCVAGQWSAAIQMAPGSQCYPAGINDFMNVGFAATSSVVSSSASASSDTANNSTLPTTSCISATTTAETAPVASASHESGTAPRWLLGVWISLFAGATASLCAWL